MSEVTDDQRKSEAVSLWNSHRCEEIDGEGKDTESLVGMRLAYELLQARAAGLTHWMPLPAPPKAQPE
jgi:hypothetical protein